MTEVCHRLQCLNVFTGHLEPVQVFSAARSEYFGTPSLVMGNSCSRAPWSEITEAGVTPSVILLFQPGPSSSCLFCGWLLAGSLCCGTTGAPCSPARRRSRASVLTCLQFIRAGVGGWLHLKPDLIFRKEVSFHLKRSSTSLQGSHVPWDHLPRSSGAVFFTSWCCLDFWVESAVALGNPGASCLNNVLVK